MQDTPVGPRECFFQGKRVLTLVGSTFIRSVSASIDTQMRPFREMERDAADSIWRNSSFGGCCAYTAYLIW